VQDILGQTELFETFDIWKDFAGIDRVIVGIT
jgi:hypothetical protein